MRRFYILVCTVRLLQGKQNWKMIRMIKVCGQSLGCFFVLTCALNPGVYHDVREHGAKGDGATNDTEPLQASVDAAAKQNGGVVWIPAGTYRCGTIHLKSNIEIHLASGATLQMSPDENDFDPFERLPYDSHADVETTDFRHALLAGDGIHNVAITGQGAIDGNRTKRGGPKPVALRNSQHLTIRGVTIRNAPSYAVSLLGCDYVDVDGVTILNGYADGIDPDSSRFVRIANCFVESYDDAICPKTSLALGQRRSTEQLTVTNCVISSSSNHFKLGTESSGDFKDIALTNCTMVSRIPRAAGDYSGIAIESVDGARIDGLVISNIVMRDVGYPLFIRLGNRGRGLSDPRPGSLQNVSLTNIIATGASGASSITGLPGAAVKQISLDNIRISATGGGRSQRGLNVPEVPAVYPEANMFGALPAYGFYVRHADGLTLRNVQVGWEQPDTRSALVFDDVTGLDLDGFIPNTVTGDQPVVWLNAVRNALVRGVHLTPHATEFLRLTGRETAGISLLGSDFANADEPVHRGPDVPPSVLSETGNVVRRKSQ
jgi:polygalacturonase